MTEGRLKVAAVRCCPSKAPKIAISTACSIGLARRQRRRRLIVFPEASNNGYFFEDRSDAHEKATPIPGPFTDALGRRPQARCLGCGRNVRAG